MSGVGGNTGAPPGGPEPSAVARTRRAPCGRVWGPPNPAALRKTTLPGAPRLHPRPPFAALREPDVFKALTPFLTPAPVQRALP